MELKKAITLRRSIRKYNSKPIDDELLTEIIENACFAPSAMNVQPWFFVVVKSEENKGKLLNLMKEATIRLNPKLSERFKSHPEVVIDTNLFMNSLGNAPVSVLVFLNKEYGENYFIDMVQSASACIQNFCLLAYESGLSTCWISGIRTIEDEVRREFGENLGQLVALVTVGYSNSNPVAPKRKLNRVKII